MKKVTKKLNKAQITAICLLIATIAILAIYLVIRVVIPKLAKDDAPKELPEVREYEALYLGRPVAYPTIEEKAMTFIEVNGPNGRFGMSRDSIGNFLFHYYLDGKETPVPYIPPIYAEEAQFNYTSLYAKAGGNGFAGVYSLTYMCNALSTPYFSERIELPSEDADPEGRAELLRRYGLTSSEATQISFIYLEFDENGKAVADSEKAKVISIGKKAVSGIGYYFLVSDGNERDCIYYTASDYYSYAVNGFQELVNGMLITEGLGQMGTHAPLLTPSFKQWVTTMHDKADDVIGSDIIDKSDIVFSATERIPIDNLKEALPESSPDGYTVNEIKKHFDIAELVGHAELARIKAAFLGRNVGEISGDELIITIINDGKLSEDKLLSFGEDGTVTYTYKITAIESAITATDERTDGKVLDTDTYVKVTYTYTEGEKALGYNTHAVIKLSDLAEDERAKLVGADIGELGEGNEINITLTYSKDENAVKSVESFVLTGIVSIFDEYGANADKVTETGSVLISYYSTLDGVKSEETTMLISMPDNDDSEKTKLLKNVLLGKSKGTLNTTVYNNEFYYEVMRSFASYDVKSVDYFVVNELKVSFKFTNTVDKDPFYETNYQNTLSGRYALYGLNDACCIRLVRLLGGISTTTSGTSSQAQGLSGETVAVGLTVENMKKYGLYAHKILFVLPRGIYTEDVELNTGMLTNEHTIYHSLSEIEYNIYISEEHIDEDGKPYRYMGSDMYDIVAKVDSSEFGFLDRDFVEFWADRNMISGYVGNIASMKVEFNMDDLKGVYNFEQTVTEMYQGYENGKIIISNVKKDNYEAFDEQKIIVTTTEDSFSTRIKELMTSSGLSMYNLDVLYDKTQGDGNPSYYSGTPFRLGVTSFNDLYQMLLRTRYQDIIEENRDDDAANDILPTEATRVFSLTIKLSHVRPGSDNNGYKFDFHRIDDRRVMVCTYRTDENGNKIAEIGEVYDFYISTFGFKKLVAAYVTLLNGGNIDSSVSYPEV